MKTDDEDISMQSSLQNQTSGWFGASLPKIVDLAYVFDVDGRFIYANQGLATLLDMTADGIVGKTYLDLPYPPAVAARLQQQIWQVIDTHGILVDTVHYISPSGVSRDYEYMLTPVLVGGGNVKLVIGSSQDVTARNQWEAALRRSEEENQQILESMREGFLSLDQDGRFIYINQHAASLLGHPVNDLLGKTIQEQYPELVGSKFEHVYRQAMHEKVISSVTAFYANHGRWYDVCAYPAANGIIIYFKDVTEHVRAEETIRAAYSLLDQRVQERTEKLAAENQVRQALIRKMVEAQEAERARIARELHEDTAQQLTMLMFGLSSLRTLELPAQAQERVDTLIPAAHEFLEKVHSLVDDLRTPLLDVFGLEVALQDYAEKWQHWSKVPITIDCRGFEGRQLSSALEIALYRIVQEALTNITQHAVGVTQVRVSVVWQGDEVVTTIEDNGSGFEITPLKQHLGLQTMEERASLLGGTLSIESTLGRGTRIAVQLPALVG